MLTREIKSLQHPLVKKWRAILKEPKEREAEKSVILSCDTLISELSDDFSYEQIFLLEGAILPKKIKTKELFYVTKEILSKVTGLPSPEKFAARLAIQEHSLPKEEKRLLVIDHVADPGNMGTLLRSARAFGWNSIFLFDGSCDIYNEKALRAAKGATFFLNYARGNAQDLEKLLKKWAMPLVIADSHGENTIPNTPSVALLLSNESKGLSSFAQKEKLKIAIPMEVGAESLNVAVAGSILMHTLRDTNG